MHRDNKGQPSCPFFVFNPFNTCYCGVGVHPFAGASEEPRRDPKLARAWANLELSYGAGPEEVEKAWKRLSRMYHPDRHVGDPERERTAVQLMQGINQARETLRRHFRRKG